MLRLCKQKVNINFINYVTDVTPYFIIVPASWRAIQVSTIVIIIISIILIILIIIITIIIIIYIYIFKYCYYYYYYYYCPMGYRQRMGTQPPWLVVGGDFYRVYFFPPVLFLAFWSFHLHLMLSNSSLKPLRSFGPKGGRALLVSPRCLESQGCHLIRSFYLLSCYSA